MRRLKRYIPLVVYLWGAGLVQGVDLFVAPNGKDTWSGRLPAPNAEKTDGPLATLHAARDAARKLPTAQPRRIVLQAGSYFLAGPLVLDARDSGLVIEAAKDQKVLLYGGRRITGLEKDEHGFWQAKVEKLNDKAWDFRMLVVDGRFCPRARLPKEGTFTHLSEFKVPWMSTTGGGWKRKPTNEELTTLKYRPEDLDPSLDVKSAELQVFHMWDESVVGLASMNAEDHTLRFATSAGHPPGAFGVKKYVVWNVRQGITEPGQWVLNKAAGTLVYRPRPDDDVAKAQVIAPTIASIIRLHGTKEKHIRDVTLRGLTLSVTNTPLTAGGFGAGKFEGAIQAHLADNCVLENLRLVNVGGQGIRTWQCDNWLVSRCEVADVGACGLMIRGTNCRTVDNHVHHVGRLYPSAIGIWGGGTNCLIAHNEVHDTPYSAVICGGQDNRIERNLLYRAMLELHDGGGIYISMCKRITLRSNVIRDIPDTGGYGASAYYLDEQAEQCVVENNLSLRVARPSHNHMAKNNTIRNNVFIIDGDAQLTFPKSADYRFEQNIVYAKGTITFTNPDAITTLAKNVLFSAKGQVKGVALKNYTKTGESPLDVRGDNVLADPLFVDPTKENYRFAPDSPAARLGIKPLDSAAAGIRAAE